MDFFYRESGKEQQKAFDKAWLHHQNVNDHHWQYWILMNDDNGLLEAGEALQMDYLATLEMIADWKGASRMHNGNVHSWFAAHRHIMRLHPATRKLVESLL